MIQMIIEVIAFLAVYAISFTLGYLTSEKWCKPNGIYDVYPWMCRKCATSQLMVVLYTCVALIFGSLWFFILGALVTVATALEFMLTEKEKGI